MYGHIGKVLLAGAGEQSGHVSIFAMHRHKDSCPFGEIESGQAGFEHYIDLRLLKIGLAVFPSAFPLAA